MLSRNKERLLARLKGGRSRSKEEMFVVEGVRCAEEALAHGVDIRFAVCSPRLEVSDRGLELASRIEREVRDAVWVDDPTLETLAHTESPQGIVLACREPVSTLDDLFRGPPGEGGSDGGGSLKGRRLLVLDGVQDPGNLGSLIRAGAAFGVHGLLALTGTVDPWNSKSVRASAGACFMVPIVRASARECLEGLSEREVPILVAEMEGEEVGSVEAGETWALVIGSEADGASEAMTSAAAQSVSVPMVGPVESLNAAVAGGILLYALTWGKETK